MNQVQLAALGVALVVRVVEALAHLHGHVAGHRDRKRLGLVAHAIEDRPQVAPMDVLEGDEEAVVDLTEVEDLRDVRVLQLHGDLRLVDEHRDELFVLGDVREDAFHREEALEALHAKGLRFEDFGHTSHVDPLKEVVLSERDGLLQRGHISRDISYLQLRLGFFPGARPSVPRPPFPGR